MGTHNIMNKYQFWPTINNAPQQQCRVLSMTKTIFYVIFFVINLAQSGCRPVINVTTDKDLGRYNKNSGGPSKVEALEICGDSSSSVLSLIFTDNQHLCSGSSDGMVKFFDLEADKKEINSFHNGEVVPGVYFLPSMNQVITADASALYKLNYPEFSKVIKYYRAISYYFIAFSNGTAIFEDPDKGILILDIKTKQIRQIFPPDGNLGGINAAEYSYKEKFLVAGGAAGILRLWDIKAEKPKIQFDYKIGCPIFSLAVSPDGDIIAVSASDKVIRLLNAKLGSVIKNLNIESNGVDQRLLFTKDGEVLISIEPMGDNCQPSLIRFWDVKSGKEICSPVVGHKSRIKSACLSPDNSLLATGSLDGSILIWKIAETKHKK